jgi:hypothetical protein
VLGEEAGGAFFGGLRYGEGVLYTKNAGDLKVYWQGPTVGWDFGGEGGFEPVSAETQPVSGQPRTQISDIGNPASRDTPRDSRLFGARRPRFHARLYVLSLKRRLTLDVAARVTWIGRAEPQTRRASRGPA